MNKTWLDCKKGKHNCILCLTMNTHLSAILDGWDCKNRTTTKPISKCKDDTQKDNICENNVATCKKVACHLWSTLGKECIYIMFII